MKRICLILLSLLFLTSCSSPKTLCDYKIVYVDDSIHKIGTAYGDSNATRLINTVDIIVKVTAVSSSKPEYSKLGLPQFIHTVKILEVIKGSDFVSVGENIQVLSHCGYDSFSEYISSSPNSADARLKLTETEIFEYSSDPEAMVALSEQNGLPLYEGGDFVLLLCYDEEFSRWTVWSDRSSVMEYVDGNLIGYAVEYLGKTYTEFVEAVENAEKTPEIKYDMDYISGLQSGTVTADEYLPNN